MDPNTDSRRESDHKDLLQNEDVKASASHAGHEEFEEAFEDLKHPELEFPDKWTLWEQYETKDSSNYKDTMMKVAWFNDPISFWKVWNTVPHAEPVNYVHYFDEEVEKAMVAKHYISNGVDQKISAVSLFKTGILPAWEDPVNAKGGEFSVKLKCNKDDIKPLWENLILEVISGNFPYSELVWGLRLLDKAQMFKVEVWVKYSSKSDQDYYFKHLYKVETTFEQFKSEIKFFSHKK